VFAQTFGNLGCTMTIAAVYVLPKLGSKWILIVEMALAALRCLISKP